jgi:hypothetical protein
MQLFVPFLQKLDFFMQSFDSFSQVLKFPSYTLMVSPLYSIFHIVNQGWTNCELYYL